MIAVRFIIIPEARSGSRHWSVIVVTCSSDPLMIKAAGCVARVRTISAIVTGGRISSIVKLAIKSYYPAILESDLYRM